MPPLRLATSTKPACCKIAVACAERLPGAAYRDDWLILRQLLGARGELAQGNQHRTLDMAERPGKLLGLTHIENLHRTLMLLEPVRIDLPDAGKAVAQMRPARVGRRVD